MKAKPKPEPKPAGISVTKFEKVKITVTINGQKIELTKEEAVKLRDELDKVTGAHGLPLSVTEVKDLWRKLKEDIPHSPMPPHLIPNYYPYVPCKQPDTGTPLPQRPIVTCSI